MCDGAEVRFSVETFTVLFFWVVLFWLKKKKRRKKGGKRERRGREREKDPVLLRH